MGTISRSGTGLAEVLFSSVQRRLLALLFGHPDTSFQSAEVIRKVRGGTGGVLRELRRLEEAGALTVTRIGNQKHYLANRQCPGFQELHALVVKILGDPGSVRLRSKSVPISGPGPERGPNEIPSSSLPLPAPRPVRNEGWKVW